MRRIINDWHRWPAEFLNEASRAAVGALGHEGFPFWSERVMLIRFDRIGKVGERRPMAKRTQQHIVPQFLLNQFAREGRIFSFDKSTGRKFATTAEKAAKESGYYDFQANGKSSSFEEPLSNLEGSAAPIILKLLETRRIKGLARNERATLGLFCLGQMLRSRNSREAWLDLRNQTREHLKKFGADPKKVKGFGDPSDEEMREFSIMHLARAHEFLPAILDKDWSLQIAPAHCDLYISDSPVTLHNELTFGPYGNLGLAVAGIEVALPLSAELNLWITCRTIKTQNRSLYWTGVFQKWVLMKKLPHLSIVKNLVRSLNGLEPFRLAPANVERLNSLQVLSSERFLYSRSGDFSLAERMIAKNPAVKIGRRMRIN